jgi:hypothetical protein
MDIPYQTVFLDFNYTSLVHTAATGVAPAAGWAPAWESGFAAAMERTNMSSQYLSFNGFILNGTSRKIRQHVQITFGLNNSHPGGIVPFIPTFNNWTRVEAIQQGLTAEVNCTQTPASDPYIRINQTAVTPKITEVFFCCNCTSENQVESIGGEG